MLFSELIQKRESCRAYKDTPVEREKLSALIEAGRIAPSACNSQPWHFVVVDEPSVVQEVGKSLQDKIMPINKFASSCPSFIVIVEGNANISSKLGGKYKDQDFAEIDIGIAATHICLQATELGLGTCIVGWFDEKRLKEVLKIPSSKRVRLVLAVGYPNYDKLRTKIRKPVEDIMSFNEWKQN